MHADTDHPAETNAAVPVGWVGLMLPFVITIGAVIAFGSRSLGQIGAALLLLLVPLAVLALRRAQTATANRRVA